MRFNIIASGSKGNCTVIVSNKTAMLIDMGISLSRLKDGCEELGIKFEDIKYAFFTHNHGDHISGIKCFSPRMMFAQVEALPGSLYNKIRCKKTYDLGDFKVTPFKTSHDAPNPSGYVIEDDKDKLVYMTDTGIVLEEVFPVLDNPTYLIIESNHDIQMLMKSDRSNDLKQRILSDKGHLCNEDSAFAAARIIGDRTKCIYLAHLSEECNTPETALAAYDEVFKHQMIDISKYKIICANQHHSTLGGDVDEN